MHNSYTQLMYGKYTLFYESPKNWGCLRTCASSVYQASPRGEEPGDEARQETVKNVRESLKWNVTIQQS